MRRVLIILLACCLLAASGCGAANFSEQNVPVPVPTETPAPTTPAPTSTAVATFTPAAQATTSWVPPTALAGTPIPGAEATLTAAPALTRTTLIITNSMGQTVNMTVEVAGTEPARELGLMFRPSMPPDQGMLFDFQGDTSSSFWMANTILPLSIAFIDSTGKILGIEDMQPLDRNGISAPGPYHYALETNQGYFRAHSIVEGNKVTIGSVQSAVIPGMPGVGRQP